jgi:hypothetical protein
VALSLSNSLIGRLYVNGLNVATGSITLTPDQVNAPNVNTAAQHNYIARGSGSSLPFFQGALDSLQIYTGPLTDAEIGALQALAVPAGAGTLYVDLRATNAASAAAALYSTWTNFATGIGNFTRSGAPSFSTNVAGTGIPGVSFNGSNARYSSANTSLADLTGASDRSFEVWAYNPSLASEETMVSLGDRSDTRKNCGFNFGTAAGWGAATHLNDDVPWGAMGLPAANAWHHLVYTYDGNLAVKIYVDGQLWYTDTLGGLLATPTGDPVNIGCQRASGGGGTAGQYFSGYINTVRVWGGAMTADQVKVNSLFGPWRFPPTPLAIFFAAISNRNINAGITLSVTNSATDPNQPPLPLSFSILSGPAGGLIDPVSGLFTWRPTVAQAGTTNQITLQAANNAMPALAAAQTFTVKVNPVSVPTLSDGVLSNSVFTLQVNGDAGLDYTGCSCLSNPQIVEGQHDMDIVRQECSH